jgi:5,10-methylenetetrahydromethanopterin reductase
VKLSLGLPPGPRAVEYARLAEDMGYARVWLFDSAALYEDIWIWLSRIAEHTSIDIGTAVLVPNLRHVMTTASAIATVEDLAPGRLAVGIGTGATARWVLGQPALSWATTRRYVEQLRGLLNGEVVDVDGARTQMIHYEGWAPPRPIRVPILLSAFGPKGQAIAREIADGIITGASEDLGFGWHVQMISGTVLEPGETPTSERVMQAVGPWLVLIYHGTWQYAPQAVAGLPGGAQWLAGIEAERPEGERHLAVHEGHVVNVTPRDKAILEIAASEAAEHGSRRAWIGTSDELRARAEQARGSGATELLYTPAGPDVAREIRSFAAALLD